MDEVKSESRRRFHVRAIYSLMGLITAALAAPAAMYLLAAPRSRNKGAWVEAGDIAALQPGKPEEMTFERDRVDGWKTIHEKSTAWVVKTADNQAVAFAPQCTHLGCAYHWDDAGNNFLCPCHTSTFDIQGKVLGGPAPRPLDRYQVKLDGSKLMLGEVNRASNA